MARNPGTSRASAEYVDGVNTFSAWNVAKKQELSRAENFTSPVTGAVERRQGSVLLGDGETFAGAGQGPLVTGLFFNYLPTGVGFAHSGLFRLTNLSATYWNVSYLGASDAWQDVGTVSTPSAGTPSAVVAENRCFIATGTSNFTVNPALTVTAGTSPAYLTNDFFGAPVGGKVNYYKGRLYLADVTYGSSRYQTQVHMSSPALGIVSLVDGDWGAGSATINVTDTKYVFQSDTLDVYRGDAFIVTLNVVGKTETSITVTPPAVALKSADELWAGGTNPANGTGTRRFRWTQTSNGGVPVKEYDTFLLPGGDNSPITVLANVGPYQIIGNNTVMAAWDGVNLNVDDSGIGCVSKNGSVRFSNLLYYVNWKGVFTTSGGPPKLVSSPVDAYFRGATRSGLENAKCGKKGFSLFFSIGDVTLYNDDGSVQDVLSGVVLEYDQRKDNWYVHAGLDAQAFGGYVDATLGERMVYAPSSLVTTSGFGAVKPALALFEGDYDYAGTLSAREIPCRMDFHHWQLGGGEEFTSFPSHVVVHSDRGNSIQCFVSLDDEAFYPINGQFDKGLQVVPVTPRTDDDETLVGCRRIKVSLRSTSRSRPRVNKVTVKYAQTAEQQVNQRDAQNE